MAQNGYYRQPAIARDRIVFACEDDLWSVPVAGGVARRLTAGAGEVTTPRLSPDGMLVAFVGREEGHPEVYVMDAEGGPARRLTFLGASVLAISGWSPDGARILFVSDAGSPFAKETHGFAIAPAGGQAEPLGLGEMRSLALSGDGRLAIGRNADDPARWKRYRGGTAGDLWVDAAGDGRFTRLIALKGNLCWPMWLGERVAFLSDHEGIGNIYSTLADGSDLRRHTAELEFFARFPSTDGARIVYAAGAQIRLLDAATGQIATVPIEAPSGATQAVRRFDELGERLEHVAPSPDGTALALISRGRPFTMPLWEAAATAHGDGSRVRYRLAEWLPDGKRFICVSDAGGRERLEIRDANAESAPVVVTHDDVGRITALAVSPVAEIVACANHRHELLIVDLEEQRIRVVDRSSASRIRDLAFSPDGRWLAYACAVPADATEVANPDTAVIRVLKIKSGAVHTITPLLRVDRAPAWDPEGKYLYLISSRDFNPVYDALQFDLSFPQASRPYCIALRVDVPSPFVPVPAPVHKHRHDHDDDEDDDRKRERKPVRVEIDFDGIQGRLLGFPVEEGDYEQVVGVRGRALFTRFPVRGIKPAEATWDDESPLGVLVAYDFEQQRSAVLQRDVGEIRIGHDARTLVYAAHDRVRVIDALGDLPEDDVDEPKPGQEPGRRSGWIDLARTSVLIEPRDEWTQMYYEAWRLQREQFWDAAMSGVDWELARDRYAKLLPLVRTRSELSDLFWEMQGELGTSHAYEIGGDRRRPPHYPRGFLGADLTWDAAAGGYRIARLFRGDSWNRECDSPLAEPGLDIREGDVITAINGRRLTAALSPDELLVNCADREVAISLLAGKNEFRRVVVRTLRDERMVRYRAWVDANRKMVHDRTNGRVGYLHIPDMGPWGFSEFHRGYLSEFNRDGLIVDVRYNRGGHVSPLLLEKLARKRIGYDVSRYGPPVPYPPESVGGPIVALTNQFAGSDGDIFSHAFKLYDLGVLVGKRTWGGVIGINPYHDLVDGTTTTQPEFSFWFVDVGWQVENYGTDPDYDIDIAPHDVRAGHDPQMEKALELIADMRASAPPAGPQFDPRPRLTIPTSLSSPT
ncbi:MAG: S41 family peptidase [Vulcanimicrobiaceae bacterium]